MTPAEKIKEWLHFYGLLKTDAAKIELFAHLKQSKFAHDKEALRQLVERWLKE